MQTVTILFEKCIQNVQELSKDDQFMFSRVFLTLIYPNGKKDSISVEIKQINGSNYNNDPLEVFPPKNHALYVDYQQFRDEVEKYYRKLVIIEAEETGIPDAVKIKMYNNIFIQPAKAKVSYAGHDNF